MLEEIVTSAKAKDIKKFCQSIGDINPIHIYERYAKKRGFNGILVPGMYLFSLAHYRLPIECPHGIHERLEFGKAFLENEPIRIGYSVKNNLQVDFMDKNSECLVRSFRVIKDQKKELIFSGNLDELVTYNRVIKERDLKKFFESLGESPKEFVNTKEIPMIYLACLINPALLKLSGGEGIHLAQEISFYNKTIPLNRPISVGVKPVRKIKVSKYGKVVNFVFDSETKEILVQGISTFLMHK